MAATPHTGHVFISYRQTEPDKQFAHRLAYDLQAAGHPVWIDVQGIEAGHDWNTEIQKALDGCYAYVVVLTPEAMASRWVRNELLYALSEKVGAIYPVLLTNVKLPPEIISIQYVDFRENYGKALAELIAHLPVPPSSGVSPTAQQGLRLPDKPAPRRLPAWMWAAALVGVALIVGLGILMSNGAKSPAPAPSPSASSAAINPSPGTSALTDAPSPIPTTGPTPTIRASDTPSAPLGSAGNPILFDFFADASTSGKVLEDSRTITDKLSAITGLTIQPKVDIKLSQIVGSMCTRSVHMSTMTTLSYLLAKERSCAVVTLVALRAGGSTYYVSQIIARGGTADVKALKGKTFCRVDDTSPSGWIMPELLLKSNGLDPATDFAAIKDEHTHQAVVQAVYNNECDGGGTFSDTRTDLLATFPDVLTKVKFLVGTPKIPNDIIAFEPSVPEEMRSKITNAMIQLAGQKDTGALLADMNNWSGLQKADDSMYDPFRLFFASTEYKLEDFVK